MPFRLFLITDRKLAAPRTLDEVIGAALSGAKPGDVAVQIREKDLPDGDLLDLARRLREVTRRFGARLFVNGRPDVAAAAGADGVHLPGGSVSPADARKMFPGAVVGMSTHSVDEAVKAAESGADFVVTGPVFQTRSKPGLTATMGIDGLSRVCAAVSIPVFALGGMDARNAADAIHAGAQGVAVLSAVMAAADPGAAVVGILRALKSAR